MANNWHVGNAPTDGQEHRGWLIGHFLGDADGVRASRDVEVKWGVHPAGEGREEWVTDEQRTTLLLLVSGRFRLDLSVGSAAFLADLRPAPPSAAITARLGCHAGW